MKREEIGNPYIVRRLESGEAITAFNCGFENTTAFNRFRRKRFVNEKRLKSYPAVKIGRLGVSESAKGMALGTRILNLVKWMYMSNNRAGCRFITVDAYKNAVPFYEKNKFNLLLSTQPEEDATVPMYFDLKDLIV